MNHAILPKRKNRRLQGFDYSQNGIYFLTICTKDKAKVLSDIVGRSVYNAPHIRLSPIGKVVEECITLMNIRKTDLSIEKYVIMPNHIHLLVSLENDTDYPGNSTPQNMAIPKFVALFKRYCYRKIGYSIWQTSYYDHVVRSEDGLRQISEYIDTNPIRWTEDRFYFD